MVNPISGNDIARQAVKALRLPNYTAAPGRCEQFARQVFESLYPDYTPITRHFLASARVTMESFRDSIYNVWSNSAGSAGKPLESAFLRPGDYLYKGNQTSGPSGHVGIFFHNIGADGLPVGSVAENSLYHMNPEHDGNISGAKGIRTLTEFGAYEMVVRMTEDEV